MQVALLHAATAAVVAGLWISAATLLAERLGTRAGGLVGNLPSNILVALVFVALTQGVGFVARATLAVPIGMSIDALFLVAFVLLLPRGLPLAVAGSLALWLALALVAQQVAYEALAGSLLLFALVTAGSFWILERRVRSVPGTRRPYGPREVALRAAFAGTVVGGTVLLAGLLGAYWTGLLGTFPAVLLSTLVILARKQGADFARATGKVLVLGSTNIVVYALVVRWAYPALGVAWGTLLGLAAALAWVAMLRPLLRRVS
ncbi:MAG TPA: hypothetical protein VFH78_00960 [Candidatus Thermoplasmatota archaeon]|nr:hypothetical protein [Candidatus Thermoplasmatota archaeon]